MPDLNGKLCLISGANRGIGLALVRRFRKAGATVIATVRSDRAEAELRSAIADPDFAIERCDIARGADVAALSDRVRSRIRHLDVLINNAGLFVDADRRMSAAELDLDVLRETLDTNLFGTIAMCKAFAPMMSRDGRIINVSSTMGQLSDGGIPSSSTAYSVSKTALNAYTSALANALRVRGILADVMHPGWVKTDMGGSGANLEPEEATNTAFFLATRVAGETGLFWDRSRVTAW